MKILNNLKKKYVLLSLSVAFSLAVTSLPLQPLCTDSVPGEDVTTVEVYTVEESKIMPSYFGGIIDITATTTTNTTTKINSTTNSSSSTTFSTTSTEVVTTLDTTTLPTTTSNISTNTTTNLTTTSTVTTTKPVDTTTTITTTKPVETYIVYKPSTHYIHTSNCRWCDDTCQKIVSTEGLECRKCTECNPDIEIIKEYQQPVTTVSNYGLTDYDIMLLRKIVSSEYGADWVPVEEKAKIVASVMTMVRDPRYPNTISGVLAVACEPWGFNRYKNYYMSDSIIAAVDYYFANQNTVFANWCYTSWYGDGRYNYFHC